MRRPRGGAPHRFFFFFVASAAAEVGWRRRGRTLGVLALFDVDGILTAPRKEVTPMMLEFMKRLRENVTVGVVGGSDLVKTSEQLGKSVITDYDYVFSENSLVVDKDGKPIGTQSLKTYLGDDQLKISFGVFPQGWDKTYCLRYLNEFKEIHFFGDKTYKGGNDHEIFESERTVGHTVTSPDDMVQQYRSIFLSK